MQKLIFILSLLTFLVMATTLAHAKPKPKHRDISNCKAVGIQKVKPFKHKAHSTITSKSEYISSPSFRYN